jgi:PAS domain S-box-containing protein
MIETGLTTEAIRAVVLVVDACADTEALLADAAVTRPGLEVERTSNTAAAIDRVESGDAVDVVLLSTRLEDPVRVAQRLHSLDPHGAVVTLALPERADELRHAIEVAPFLDGDVVLAITTDARQLGSVLSEAARRTRTRRDDGAALPNRRDTPPPLSARYLGTLLDSAPIGIVTLDADGAVIGWNRRAGEMLEVAEVEALGMRFAEFWSAEDRHRLAALVASVDASGLAAAGEAFERGGRAFEITGAPFTIRSGEPGTLLVLQDVSSRVAAERELSLQKALLEAQAESSIAGIAVVTLDGKLELINKRLASIWGVHEALIRHDRDAAMRSTLGQVLDPDAFNAGVEALASNPGGEYSDEVRLKDGRTIERYGTHFRTDDGRIVGRVWFHTDITERKREAEALRFLADATDLLSSSLDYSTTLRRVARLAVPRIADWCSVEIGDRGRLQQLAVAHADPAKVEFARAFRERYPEDPDSGAVATVMRTGESRIYPVIPDGVLEQAAQDVEHLQLLRELQLHSVMIVPIQMRGRSFGAITFVSAESGHSYDDDDLRLAQELARRAAIAIDNSRVHAELRDTARTLQESLLPPHLPALEHLELAALFRPAGAGIQVGGDFYDVFDIGDGEWCIVVGDVCGKGAEAAALTALTRYTARAAATYENTIGGVLEVLNRALLHQRGDFRFTTLAFCALAVTERPYRLRAASAGHPRPLLLRPDGSVRPVGAAGPLLGVVADARFSEEQLELDDGDVIVLYTDGLTDAYAPDRMLVESDLLAALRDCAGLSAAEVAQHLERVALGSNGAEPRDDIAILVARVGE